MSRNVTVSNPEPYTSIGIRPYANLTINVDVKYGAPVVLDFDAHGFSPAVKTVEAYAQDNGLVIIELLANVNAPAATEAVPPAAVADILIVPESDTDEKL